MTASSRPGMGALPYPGGVTFRVWAPFAAAVTVAGTFNGWNPAATALSAEGHGYWSTDVPTAAVNDHYKFVISNPGLQQPLWKNDPYALALTNSVGDSIVVDPDYAWQCGAYATPSWNEL